MVQTVWKVRKAIVDWWDGISDTTKFTALVIIAIYTGIGFIGGAIHASKTKNNRRCHYDAYIKTFNPGYLLGCSLFTRRDVPKPKPIIVYKDKECPVTTPDGDKQIVYKIKECPKLECPSLKGSINDFCADVSRHRHESGDIEYMWPNASFEECNHVLHYMEKQK